mgnify:CR=1 FL=1
MNNNSNSLAKLLPMMLCFFAMGFVDLVGIASNYVKADLNLTDSQANIFPSLVFFWFLIFSVPTGMLMNRIGRKKTVLLSLAVTFASLLLPVFGDGYDADIAQSAAFQCRQWRAVGKLADFRTVCKGYRFFPRSLYSYVGGYTGYPFVGDGLASAVSHLYGDSGCRYPVAGHYIYS